MNMLEKLRISDKTLNKLIAFFAIVDVILLLCNIFVKNDKEVKEPDEYEEYMVDVNSYIDELKEDGYEDIDYKRYVYNDRIFSVAIFATKKPLVDDLVKVYNIDLETGEELTLSETLDILVISNDSFQEQFKTGYIAFFESDNETYLKELESSSEISEEEKIAGKNEIDIMREEMINVNYNTYIYDDFYLDEEGNLCIFIDNTNWRTTRKLIEWRQGNTFNYKIINIE